MQNGLLTFGFSFTPNVLMPLNLGPPPIISKSSMLRIKRLESHKISILPNADAALMHFTAFRCKKNTQYN